MHAYNFKNEGNVFTWSWCQGENIEAPLIFCKADISITFMDEGQYRLQINEAIQLLHMGPNILDDFIIRA